MISMKNIIYSSLIICVLLLFSNNLAAQVPSYVGDSKGESYRDRLIYYADIYSYKIDPKTKDTILYVRKINDWWYGIFGTANFVLSFGDFKSAIDPNNPYNIFNAIVNFYGQLGTGYTFGLMGEWERPTTDFSIGLKLGAFDRKLSNVATEYVAMDPNYLNGNYDFRASLTYFTLNPYAKYKFPRFDGFFVTAGVDLSAAYSSLAYLERSYINTGDIYHRMNMDDINGNTRFLINLGAGYDFFIADFFGINNRVRVTPFADFKGGTNIITSGGSNWNDVTINVGLQIKLAPDKIKIDTLIFDPASEIPIDYMVDVRNETGFEFAGFTGLADPPSFELEVIRIVERLPEPEDVVVITQEISTQPQPQPRISSPALDMTIGTIYSVGGFASSTTTTLTPDTREQLDQYIAFLKENPDKNIRVEGHSDDRGTREQNNSRATARTNSVVRYLVSQGISDGRIFRRGRGSAFPVASNETARGRERNRRVEITIMP